MFNFLFSRVVYAPIFLFCSLYWMKVEPLWLKLAVLASGSVVCFLMMSLYHRSEYYKKLKEFLGSHKFKKERWEILPSRAIHCHRGEHKRFARYESTLSQFGDIPLYNFRMYHTEDWRWWYWLL
jgi:hypothetical protein